MFAKAWVNAITPANLISGFKTCGVFPLNRAAITIPGSIENDPTSGNGGNASGNGGNASSNAESSATLTKETDADGNTESSDDIAEDSARDLDAASQQFTAEQEALFERRLEEGCDLHFDEDYIRWLNLNHPEFRSSTCATLDDHPSTGVLVPCEEPASSSSEELTCNNSVQPSEMSPGNTIIVNESVSGPTSSLSDLLVCPALSTSAVPKRPPTHA